jgi:lysophospholipase L1-like esterase
MHLDTISIDIPGNRANAMAPKHVALSMVLMKPLFSFCASLLIALATQTTAHAEVPAPAGDLRATAPAVAPLPVSPEYAAAVGRWQASLSAFDNADKERLPGEGGVLFVGSSTIRFWTHLAQDFREQPVVINRGFGGSTMADCSLFTRELVVRYRPRHVLVYAGDNDLAEGRTPLQVLDSFIRFARTVRETLPDARISYISVKPSPSREALLPKIRETNNILSAYVRTLDNSEYIDIFTPMMGADNRPRADLFLGDRLHMNETGYRLWHSVIASHVGPAPAALAAAPALPAPAGTAAVTKVSSAASSPRP